MLSKKLLLITKLHTLGYQLWMLQSLNIKMWLAWLPKKHLFSWWKRPWFRAPQTIVNGRPDQKSMTATWQGSLVLQLDRCVKSNYFWVRLGLGQVNFHLSSYWSWAKFVHALCLINLSCVNMSNFVGKLTNVLFAWD